MPTAEKRQKTIASNMIFDFLGTVSKIWRRLLPRRKIRAPALSC